MAERERDLIAINEVDDIENMYLTFDVPRWLSVQDIRFDIFSEVEKIPTSLEAIGQE